MAVSRRSFLAGLSAIVPGAAGEREKLKLGVTDWNLEKSLNPESLAIAKRLGFAGVELAVGNKPKNGRMPLDDEAMVGQYVEQSNRLKIPIAGISLSILLVNYLKNDPLAQKWVRDSIPLVRKLGARVVLVPFFYEADMKTQREMDYVADVLKEISPEAEKAGVVLGLEDMRSAEETVRIMDRTKSGAVKVYYDVFNSLNYGYDIIREIRWLGKDRICQFHFKEDAKQYLGGGRVDFVAVLKAIRDIGYEGFANFETSSPSGDVDTDMRRNLAYIRGLAPKFPGLISMGV
jgi:sugar phosphate isomerase/epimerase